jgi:heme-degrading monooxygenase HmoA
MPYLLERHKVRDYDRWRGVFDADSAGRAAAGCRGARIFRNAEDPEEVVVLFEWDSLESARRRIESATLSRKFEEAGVNGGSDKPSSTFSKRKRSRRRPERRRQVPRVTLKKPIRTLFTQPRRR